MTDSLPLALLAKIHVYNHNKRLDTCFSKLLHRITSLLKRVSQSRGDYCFNKLFQSISLKQRFFKCLKNKVSSFFVLYIDLELVQNIFSYFGISHTFRHSLFSRSMATQSLIALRNIPQVWVAKMLTRKSNERSACGAIIPI